MIHINNTGAGRFYVTIVADGNRQVLAHSEVLNSKAACFKNIRAIMKLFVFTKWVKIQDNTLPKPKVYHLGARDPKPQLTIARPRKQKYNRSYGQF